MIPAATMGDVKCRCGVRGDFKRINTLKVAKKYPLVCTQRGEHWHCKSGNNTNVHPAEPKQTTVRSCPFSRFLFFIVLDLKIVIRVGGRQQRRDCDYEKSCRILEGEENGKETWTHPGLTSSRAFECAMQCMWTWVHVGAKGKVAFQMFLTSGAMPG